MFDNYRHEDDEDLRGAAETASRHAGDSGDTSLFGGILNAIGQNKGRLEQEDIDEDDAVRNHQQFFGGGGNVQEATSGGMGAAAAMQALKMFSGGEAQGSQSKSAFIGLAMSEASKLFDQKASQGQVSSDSSKESAIMKAGEMALKMYMKGQAGGPSSGPGGLLGTQNTSPSTNQPSQTTMELPKSYNTLSLPDIKLSHHPASAPEPTPVILVILDRPAQKNAFTTAMARSLATAFDLLSADPRVRAVVLTGSDPANRTFCPGADLDIGFSVGGDGVARDDYRDTGGHVALAMHRCAKPVVAAVNGSAVGVGMTMVLPAAVRVVSDAAKLGFVFARRGITMEACSSFFLPRLIGTARALHLVTTGQVVGPRHRLVEGLFGEVVPAGEVVPTALRIAEEIAASTSGVSTRVMRDMMYLGPGTPEEAHLLESSVLYDMFHGRDMKEGVASFMEKRPARFRGTMEEDRPAIWPWWDTQLLEKAKAKL
ncbi:uncharacterized protein E0L32_004483 [Thyridium curvatum]|uniref:DUF7721 domain-containing protein n=1 Tax=Thyridium curvatum TaxID=1093900 RepID=A0A507B736_9PEZI|nr:uncharacterized protein E0L32_004483 [Thyridium curvatum]TPX15503.1 hypothetical protein E0L32_004483 [Thyridium curvatum]